MRILLVKTSSLGDVIHNLPVVNDLRRAFPEARIDWCVEEAFADIPRLHPEVGEVIPVAIRRWRKSMRQSATWRQISEFKRHIGKARYDAILDTQGLIKSGLISSQAKGHRYGYAPEVARELLASRFYDETFVISHNAHAVERNRLLCAAALHTSADLPLDYGIKAPYIELPCLNAGRLAFLFTATSRDDKLWDEANWMQLAQALVNRGLTPVFSSGTTIERQRAERLATAVPGAIVAPALSLNELASLIARAALTIGVDTGLVHLAAALKTPTIALYISTDPALTGVLGTGFYRNLGNTGNPPSAAEVMAVAEQVLR